jgi:VWFA-related protein
MKLLAVIVATAMAQAESPQPTPTFRAGVEVVRLDVRVTGADGRPLRDLRADEVEIVEDGDSRPVVLFQHIEEPPESYAEIASRTVAGEVSTNQGAARGHLYVIIFDQLHIAPGNEQRARLAAQRFVSTRLRPGDRVALYALPGPGPQIGFTADVKRVSAALAEMHGTAEATATGAIATMTRHEAFEIVRGNELILQRVADRVQALNGTDAQRRVDPSAFGTGTIPLTSLVKEDARKIANTADGEARAVLARLSDVLRPLRAIEGRKSILLVSEGFDGDRLTTEIEEVAAAAAESYSVVNALDINRREIDVNASEPVGADQATTIHDRLSPLGSLAAETGGGLFLDVSARADRVFTALGDQSQDYYLVGFMPREVSLNDRGKYRRVTVRVRRGGARVSTRTGFTLTDAAARMDRHQAIDRAMKAPFAQQGLPLQYTTYVLRGGAPRIQNVILSLAAQLPVASADGQAADVVFVVRSAADGRVAASGRDTIPLPARREGDGTTGSGTFRVQFELSAGEYLMRAVVREPGGLVGSADRRFTVRALDGPSVETSDLILTSQRGELPVRLSAYTGDGLSGVLELAARTGEQLQDARVVVELLPIGETAATVSTTAALGEIRMIEHGVAREARVDLPLQSVLPGAYLARARVVIGADTVSQAVRELDVRQGRQPARAEDAATNRNAAFDPRAVAQSAVARDFGARAAQSPAIADEGRRGVERLGAADYAAAMTAFNTVLDNDPKNAAAAFLLGWALHGAGQDRQAISAWRRAAYLDPLLVPAHLALADMYVQLAQPALAVQALRAGLTALPQSAELRERLSKLEARQQ